MKLLTTLLIMSASGLLLSALLYVLGRLFFRRLSPSIYYYAWLIVLLRFVLPVPSLVPPVENDAASPVQTVVQTMDEELRRPRGVMTGGWTGNPGYVIGDGTQANPSVHSEDFESLEKRVELRRQLTELADIFTEPAFYIAVWLFGFGVYSINALISTRRFRRLLFGELESAENWEYELLKRLCPHRTPALYRCKALSSPILIGLVNPRLILPQKSSSRERLEHILRHELTHYRRGDLLYKHFALLVSALHWFNPFMPLIRQEIERSCELSCDERVLLNMDASGRKSYGETLLRCAADNALPAALAVSSFSVQKRHLKERLEQVLNIKKKGPMAIIASILVLALLCGCGAVAGPAQSGEDAPAPAPTPEPVPAVVTGAEDTPEAKPVDGVEVHSVDTVDEFLSAIGPDRVISMAEGSYVLSMAKDYGSGSSDWYYWREIYDGYELVIRNVTNLSIMSEAPSTAEDPAVLLLTEPRYANVLYLESCADISFGGLSVGHIEGGLCSGGVLYLSACDKVSVDNCKLFGCGTVALQCLDCDGLLVENSRLTDCSNNALSAQYSRAIVIRSCDIDLNGAMPYLFSFSSCEDSIIADCSIGGGNNGQALLYAAGSRNISLLSSQIHDNSFDCLFSLPSGSTVTVDGCEFDYGGRYGNIATENTVIDTEGNILDDAALEAMEHEEIDYEMPGDKVVDYAEGSVHVSTVDELLAAIAPNVTIYLEEGDYDLSSATEYGGYGNDYYSWEERHDGPSLLIFNCDNLSIIGAGKDKSNIYALPRYADVFSFNNCNNLKLSGFTAGHFEEPGYCSGDVIKIQRSEGVKMEELGLFGCGYIGIRASDCKNMSVKDCDIYECTGSGLIIGSCEGFEMEGCTVRDTGSVGMFIRACDGARIIDSGFARLCQDDGSRSSVYAAILSSSNVEVEGCSFFEGEDKSGVVFDNCKSVEVEKCSSDIPGFAFRAYNESGVHIDGVPLENSQGNW